MDWVRSGGAGLLRGARLMITHAIHPRPHPRPHPSITRVPDFPGCSALPSSDSLPIGGRGGVAFPRRARGGSGERKGDRRPPTALRGSMGGGVNLGDVASDWPELYAGPTEPRCSERDREPLRQVTGKLQVRAWRRNCNETVTQSHLWQQGSAWLWASHLHMVALGHASAYGSVCLFRGSRIYGSTLGEGRSRMGIVWVCSCLTTAHVVSGWILEVASKVRT